MQPALSDKVWRTGTGILVCLVMYLVSCPIVIALYASRDCRTAGLTERTAVCIVNHACINGRDVRGTPAWVRHFYSPVTGSIKHAPKKFREWYAGSLVWCVKMTY